MVQVAKYYVQMVAAEKGSKIVHWLMGALMLCDLTDADRVIAQRIGITAYNYLKSWRIMTSIINLFLATLL